MEYVLIIAGTVLPAIIMLIIFYKADRLKPEPVGLVVRVFFLGVLLTLLLLPIVYFIPRLPSFGDNLGGYLIRGFLEAFILAALLEETFKLIAFRIVIYKNKHFNELTDGILYMATISLAFAAVENVLYGLSGGWVVIGLRAVTSVPMHAAMSGIMGYFVARQKILNESGAAFKGLIIAVILHGTYNFCAYVSSIPAEIRGEYSILNLLTWGFLATLIIAGIWVITLIKNALVSDERAGRGGGSASDIVDDLKKM